MSKKYFDYEVVDLGEPYGIIEIREMTANEGEEYESGSKLIRKENGDVEIIIDEPKKRAAIFRIMAKCCESANGMVCDAEFIGNLSRKRYQKLMDAFKRVNLLDKKPEKAGNDDEAEEMGNSQTIQ